MPERGEGGRSQWAIKSRGQWELCQGRAFGSHFKWHESQWKAECRDMTSSNSWFKRTALRKLSWEYLLRGGSQRRGGRRSKQMWRLKQSARPWMAHSLRITPEYYLPVLAHSELIPPFSPSSGLFPSIFSLQLRWSPSISRSVCPVSLSLWASAPPHPLSILSFPSTQSQRVIVAVLVHVLVGWFWPISPPSWSSHEDQDLPSTASPPAPQPRIWHITGA